jgi:hypothetical protein
VNLYGINSFESDSCSLSSWRCLVNSTGGKLEKIILRHSPKQEVIYFQEILQRNFIQKYATNAVLKLRTSHQLSYSYDHDVSGCLYSKHSSDVLHQNDTSNTSHATLSNEDDGPGQALRTIPGIYVIPSLTEDTTYGMKFQVQEVDHPENSLDYDAVYYAKQQRKDNKQFVYFQFAFAYETLMEANSLNYSVNINMDSPIVSGAGGDGTPLSEKVRRSLSDQQVLVPEKDLRDQSLYLQNICEALKLNCDDLIQQDSGGSSTSTSLDNRKAEIFQKKGSRYYNRAYRHVCPYKHSSPLIVVKQLRIITYAIPCCDDLQELDQNILIPNVLSLVLKDIYCKSFHDISSSQEWNQYHYSLPASTDSNSVGLTGKNDLLLSPVAPQDKPIMKLIKQFSDNSLMENQLLNFIVHLVEKKLHLLSQEYEFTSYTKEQLISEVLFNSHYLASHLIVNNIHNLIFLLYSFLIFSWKYQKKTTEHEGSRGKSKSRPGISDECIVFWSKLLFYQSSIIRRMLIPNLIALEGIYSSATTVATKEKSLSFDLTTEDQAEKGKSEIIIKKEIVDTDEKKKPETTKPRLGMNLLKSSAPLHVISLEDDREDENEKKLVIPPKEEEEEEDQQEKDKGQQPAMSTVTDNVEKSPFSSNQNFQNTALPNNDSSSQSQQQEVINYQIKQQFLSLNRETLIACGSSAFFLDTGNEIIFYKSLVHSSSVNIAGDGEQNSNEVKQGLLMYFIHRFYEYPLIPRIQLSQAGMESSHYFNQYFLLDATTPSYHTPFTFTQFLEVIQELLVKCIEK